MQGFVTVPRGVSPLRARNDGVLGPPYFCDSTKDDKTPCHSRAMTALRTTDTVQLPHPRSCSTVSSITLRTCLENCISNRHYKARLFEVIRVIPREPFERARPLDFTKADTLVKCSGMTQTYHRQFQWNFKHVDDNYGVVRTRLGLC